MKRICLLFFISIIAISIITSCSSEAQSSGKYQAEAKFTVSVSEDLLKVADIYIEHNGEGNIKEDNSVLKTISDTNIAVKSNITKLETYNKTFTYSGADADTVGFAIKAEKKQGIQESQAKYYLSLTDSIDITTDSSGDKYSETKTTTTDFDGISKALESIFPVYCIYEIDTDGKIVAQREAYKDSADVHTDNQSLQSWRLTKPVVVSKPNDETQISLLSKYILNDSLINPVVVNASNDEVNATAIFGDNINDLKKDDYEKIVKIAAKDGEIILLEVNKTQFSVFIEGFVNSYKETKPDYMSDNFKLLINMLEEVGSDYVYFEEDEIFGVLALRGLNTFFLPNITTGTDLEATALTKTTEFANSLVKWITKADCYSDESESKALDQAQKSVGQDYKLLDAQIIDDTYIATSPYDWRNRQVPVHVRFYVWTAHNLDTGHDFYIVQQEVNAENQKWYCEIQDEHKWIESTPHVDGKHDGSYGPYQRHFNMNNNLDSKGKSVVLTKYAPVTQSGSSSVSTGVNFNLGGNIGVSGKGPTGGFSGNVMFTNSRTVSVPEVEIKAEQDGYRIGWKYEGAEIKLYERLFRWSGHTLAKGARVSSMSVMNSWIWDVDNKHTAEVYTMSSDYELISEAIDYDNHAFSYTWWTYQRTNSGRKTFALNPPSRFKANYLLQADTPAEWTPERKALFQDFMVKKFKNWFDNMDMYSPNDNLDDVAKDHFKEAVKTFEKNKDVIRTAGFTGTFDFYIKNTKTGTRLDNRTIVIQ